MYTSKEEALSRVLQPPNSFIARWCLSVFPKSFSRHNWEFEMHKADLICDSPLCGIAGFNHLLLSKDTAEVLLERGLQRISGWTNIMQRWVSVWSWKEFFSSLRVPEVGSSRETHACKFRRWISFPWWEKYALFKLTPPPPKTDPIVGCSSTFFDVLLALVWLSDGPAWRGGADQLSPPPGRGRGWSQVWPGDLSTDTWGDKDRGLSYFWTLLP